LQISRMRSLELQRPMIRATNTGATALIDHEGHVSSQLPAYTTGVLAGLVQGREGITPFAWWAGRWGLWPLLALGVLMVVVSRRWGHTGTGSVGVAAAG
jgi:apolipoprotein N-acyltransferase